MEKSKLIRNVIIDPHPSLHITVQLQLLRVPYSMNATPFRVGMSQTCAILKRGVSSACMNASKQHSIPSQQFKTPSEKHKPPHICRSSILVLLLLCLALRPGLDCVGDPGADPAPFFPFRSHSSGMLLLLSTSKLSLFCL